MPDVARFKDLPRLYRSRQRLRRQYRNVMTALDEHPRDQRKVNSLRASLPRPISDRDFWELMFWEEPK